MPPPQQSVDFATERGQLARTAGPAQVVTPKMSKGLGWKVKLTCDANKTGSLKTPVYKVISLERLGD